jgi:hypothetical protein
MPELKTLKTKEKVDAKKAYYDTIKGIGMDVKKASSKKKKGTLGSKSQKEKDMSPEKGTLGSKSDAEMEIERGLQAEEDAAYAQLEKQGMSDQGIVSPGELKEFGKDVYRGLKEKGKEFAKGFKAGAKQSIKDLMNSVKSKEKK